MNHKEVLEAIKNEDNIEWLKALQKVIGSHIDFILAMQELENGLTQKKEQY